MSEFRITTFEINRRTTSMINERTRNNEGLRKANQVNWHAITYNDDVIEALQELKDMAQASVAYGSEAKGFHILTINAKEARLLGYIR